MTEQENRLLELIKTLKSRVARGEMGISDAYREVAIQTRKITLEEVGKRKHLCETCLASERCGVLCDFVNSEDRDCLVGQCLGVEIIIFKCPDYKAPNQSKKG